jgi:AcrR family transcriptional regulator
VTPRDRILLAARAELVERGELEMGDVARRAGVGRSSLYRLCGDREGLRELVVLWMAEVGWARAEQAVRRRRGRARCLGVLAEYSRLVAVDPGLRKAIQTDPEKTLALCTDHRRAVQPYVVERVEKLLVEHADDVAVTMPLDQLAYAIVRLSESFVYADVLAGRESDLGALSSLVGLLLPARATHSRSTGAGTKAR